MATIKKDVVGPSDALAIGRATEQVFEHKRAAPVLGLTGRTGSGCSTVADEVLTKSSLKDTPWPAVKTRSADHEDRKDRIVEDWLNRHWSAFRRIQVSQVILSFALEEDPECFAALGTRLGQQDQLQRLKDIVAAARADALKNRAILDNLARESADNVEWAVKYNFSTVTQLAGQIRDVTYFGKRGLHTILFQELGDNIRRSGAALSGEVNAENLFALPKRVFSLVELGKAFNKLHAIRHDYFVIDAIRHPFEIHYLREKVARFFVVAIGTDENSRKDRLLKKMGLGIREVQALDDKEYPGKKEGGLQGYARFVSQDIENCISAADIYLSNTGQASGQRPELSKLTTSLCRYIALAQHPGLVTPTPVERCMQSAFAARLNSGCISRQVGAIVTNADYSILAFGWNDVPRGQVPCLLRYSSDLLNQKKGTEAFSAFETGNADFKKALVKKNLASAQEEEREGRHLTYCFRAVYNDLKGEKNQVHTRSLHAEENAFLQVVKYGGQGIRGGILFTTASPCELCAKKAYQLGISAIYYIDPYPGISADHVLGAGKDVPKVVLFSGVIGRAYHELYEPIMAFKDELATLLPTQGQPAEDVAPEQGTLFDAQTSGTLRAK